MRKKRRIILRGVLILLFGLGLAGSILWYLWPLPTKEEAWPSWSPDSQRLVYECYVDGPTAEIAELNGRHFTAQAADICMTQVADNKRVRLVKDSGGDYHPIWSPAGSKIAFLRHDGLYLINADGTNRRRLVHLPTGQALSQIDGVAWSPDGKYLAFAGCLRVDEHQRDIYRVDVANGALINLTQANGQQDFAPSWISNGAKIVFLSVATSLDEGRCFSDVSAGDGPGYQLRLMDINERSERIIYHDRKSTPPSFISASATGQVAFLSRDGSSNLRLVSSDSLEPSTEMTGLTAMAPMSWSLDQPWLLLYRGGGGLTILNTETGAQRHLPAPPAPTTGFNRYSTIEYLSWSPDGQQIAVTTLINPTGFYQERHIYIFDLHTGIYHPLLQ